MAGRLQTVEGEFASLSPPSATPQPQLVVSGAPGGIRLGSFESLVGRSSLRAEAARSGGLAGLSHESKPTKVISFSQPAWQAFRNNRPIQLRITGGRTVKEELARQRLAEKLYDEIRNSRNDIQKIATNLDMPEFQVHRIKEHVFYKTHQLDHGLGIGRFDPDFEIATAWKRLEAGTHIESDLQILRHEHFESRFEGIWQVDYSIAHEAANRAGHPSGLKDFDIDLHLRETLKK